jgi:hypothetical protein
MQSSSIHPSTHRPTLSYNHSPLNHQVAKAVKAALSEQARGHKEELHRAERRLQQAVKAAEEAEAKAAEVEAEVEAVGSGGATGAGGEVVVGPAARERVEEVRKGEGGCACGSLYLCPPPIFQTVIFSFIHHPSIQPPTHTPTTHITSHHITHHMSTQELRAGFERQLATEKRKWKKRLLEERQVADEALDAAQVGRVGCYVHE